MTEPSGPLASEIDKVVSNGLCSGCGACARLAPGVRMELRDGFLRPDVSGLEPSTNSSSNAKAFRKMCPGMRVPSAPKSPEHTDDVVVGRSLQVYASYATDPEFRKNGSSGGVLSALAAWLVDSGRANRVFAVAESDSPRRTTVPVTIKSREEALRAAGSRYCPASTLAGVPQTLDASDVVIAKPCEISALRAQYPSDNPGSPLLLSFFCAGTPSLDATDALLERDGIGKKEPLSSLRYRGDGWPGKFRAVAKTGVEATVSYDESWGTYLGPTMQWRCKLCADGVGESADVVCADFWEADERGYPIFDEGAGTSALVVRTQRGAHVAAEATKAGAIEAQEITPSQLAAVQPGQHAKRTNMFSRLAGAFLAGRRIPHYQGFGLLRKEGFSPRRLYGNARATWGRARRLRQR